MLLRECEPRIMVVGEEIFALFPSWIKHKTQGNNHLYLLLLNLVLPYLMDVESFFNLSHQLSRQACMKYFRCLQCCAGLLSLHRPEGMRSGLSQTLGNLALTAVSLLSGANRRAPLQLQSILCVSRHSSNTPQHVCVCVCVREKHAYLLGSTYP